MIFLLVCLSGMTGGVLTAIMLLMLGIHLSVGGSFVASAVGGSLLTYGVLKFRS